MGQSSYEIVYTKMMETDEAKKEIEEFERTFESKIFISNYEFKVYESKEVGEPAELVVVWILNFFGNIRKINTDQIGKGMYISINTDDISKRILENTWKTKVKTYNISEAVVFGKKSTGKAESFHSFFRTELYSRNRIRIENSINRILEEINYTLQSNKFLEEKQAFLRESAILSIKKALSAYRHLGDDILREACQEFLVDDVFEFDS